MVTGQQSQQILKVLQKLAVVTVAFHFLAKGTFFFYKPLLLNPWNILDWHLY